MTDRRVPPHAYAGARALVVLHEKHLRDFLETWRAAAAKGIELPETDDESYESLATLLRHVVRAARGYLTWTCDVLGLPDPGIAPVPEAQELEGKLDEYVEALLERWASCLAEVEEPRFHQPEFRSRWGTLYCVDAMLEHAVMHPIRHSFQLEELMQGG